MTTFSFLLDDADNVDENEQEFAGWSDVGEDGVSPVPVMQPATGAGYVPVVEEGVTQEDTTLFSSLTEREQIHATANAVQTMHTLGAKGLEITPEDAEIATTVFESGRAVSKHELRRKPGMILKLEALLNEYDKEVVADAGHLRAYVTNRLVEESNDDDPKIRMRALELLGKIGDVGLFVERKEILVQNRTTQDLEAELRTRLERLMHEKEVNPPPEVTAYDAVHDVTAADLLETVDEQ